MNAYMDFRDVIEMLIGKGYVWAYDENFKDVELFENKFNALSPNDFRIDEVYCCKEQQTHDVSYVFAISLVKENTKFIVINIITTEISITLGDILNKIKDSIINLLRRR